MTTNPNAGKKLLKTVRNANGKTREKLLLYDKIISTNGSRRGKKLIKFNKVCHHNAENLCTLIASHSHFSMSILYYYYYHLWQCELIILEITTIMNASVQHETHIQDKFMCR